MIMKKFRLMMMAGLMAFAMGASADEVVVMTVPDATVNEDGSFDVVVNMDFDTDQTICGWNFSITLPDGCDFNTDKTSTAAKKKCFDWEDCLEDEDVASGGLNLQARGEGGYVVAWVDADKTPLSGTHGKLVTLKMKSADPAVSGTGKLFSLGVSNDKDQGWATFGGGNKIADVIFKIGAGEEDGIKDIQAAGSKAPVYNVAGLRVNGQAKGLLIQDGKKFMVK